MRILSNPFNRPKIKENSLFSFLVSNRGESFCAIFRIRELGNRYAPILSEIIIDLTGESNALFIFILGVIANPPLLSILGARLLFNMKEAGAKGLNEGTSCGSKSTISNIKFGVPLAHQSLDETTEAVITEIEQIC